MNKLFIFLLYLFPLMSHSLLAENSDEKDVPKLFETSEEPPNQFYLPSTFSGQSGDIFAQTIGVLLDIEGVGNNVPILDFYSALGISFASNFLSLISEQAGGGGNFANNPSGVSVAFFLSGGSSIINVNNPFTDELSTFYASNSGASGGTTAIEIWSDLDATGTLLGTLPLPDTPISPTTPNFATWVKVKLEFTGSARSIRFIGIANQTGFDDIAFGFVPEEFDVHIPENTGETGSDGDPVNMFTGALNMSVTDLQIPGRGMNFEWSRHYNNNIVYPVESSMGTAWSTPYLQRLLQAPNGAINYYTGMGRVDLYPFINGVVWGDSAHHYRNLVLDVASKEYSMVADGERTHVFFDFTVPENPGRLKRIVDRFGNTMFFNYTNGLLTEVVDTYGRSIQILRDPSSTRIIGVQDFIGRQVTYSYYQDGDAGGIDGQLKQVQAPEVTTSTGNNFTGLNRKTTIYTYNPNGTDKFLQNQLLKITDPKGQDYLENVYGLTTDPDDFLYNRVIEQKYGLDRFHFHYQTINELVAGDTATHLSITNDRRGLVTERRMNQQGNELSVRSYTGFADPNLVTTLTQNRPTGKLRPTDPDFFETFMAYDAEGKKTKTTWPRGNSMSTTYNTNATERHGENNPTEMRRSDELLGDEADLVNSMTYEPVYQLLATRTDPNGDTYNYFYDYQEAAMGDLNDDTITNVDKGLLVRIEYPPITKGLAAAAGNQNIIEKFQYNAFGQITKRIDGEGCEIDYVYYPNNDPDGDGNNVAGSSDTALGGYLQSVIVDPGGLDLTTTYEYDEVGNVVSLTDPNGHETTYEVNELNQIVKTTGPVMDDFTADNNAQYEMLYFYDANDNVVEMREELENSLDDADADVPGFNSANHYEVQHKYDILDRLTEKREEVLDKTDFATEHITKYFYDGNDNMVRIQYPNNDEDAMIYDERDLLFQTIVGDADTTVPKSITTLNYDFNRNLAEEVYPSIAHKDLYFYDGFDRKKTYKDAGIDTTVDYFYDANSNLIQWVTRGDQDGGKVNIKLSQMDILFDEIDRPYEKQFAIIDHQNQIQISTAITRTQFDRNSRVVLMRNPNNNDTTMGYDQANRRTTVTDAQLNELTYVYDASSNVIRTESKENLASGGTTLFTWKFDYDELNRRRRSEDDAINLTFWDLDSRGLATTITDGEGNQITRQYDGLKRKFEENRDSGTDAAPVTITMGWRYDTRSRMTKYIDGLQRETLYAYDSHNRLKMRTNADLTTRVYTYDTEDNLTRLVRENSDIIDFDYDDTNRLITREYKDATGASQGLVDKFEYNGLSTLTRVFEEGGDELVYRRDSRNLVVTCRHRTVQDKATGTFFTPKVFLMTYDNVGNITSMTYPSTRVVNFNNYNSIELLGDITTNGYDPGANPLQKPLVTYLYDGQGRIATRNFANGVELQVGYDEVKRIKKYFHENKKKSEVFVGFLKYYDKVYNTRGELFIDDRLVGGGS